MDTDHPPGPWYHHVCVARALGRVGWGGGGGSGRVSRGLGGGSVACCQPNRADCCDHRPNLQALANHVCV
jgi:hypothetical protein